MSILYQPQADKKHQSLLHTHWGQRRIKKHGKSTDGG